MRFLDSDILVIRTFKAENAVFYGVPGFNFRINKEFVKYLLYESSYKRYFTNSLFIRTFFLLLPVFSSITT